jgi:adenosylhomocysteine nucleosidase
MSPSLAIIAALPREIALLVRGTKPDAALLRSGIYLYRLPEATVVAAGMGGARAAFAVQAALAGGPVRTLISTGLAGSCTPSLRAGDVAEPATVIDVKTGERYFAGALQGTVLVTTDAVAGIDEKHRLAAAYAADLVDMEAATVARLALAHGLRFRAIKAVSDGHDFELAVLSRFTGRRGSFRTGAFALHTALRPHTWLGAVRLGRNSGRALAALTARLRQVMDEEAG